MVTMAGAIRQLDGGLWLAEVYNSNGVLVFGIGTTRQEALDDLKAQIKRSEKEGRA